MPTIEFTDHSGTIDGAGQSQEVMAANGDRETLLVQNISDTDMWLNFGDDASADAGSILLPANGGSYESPPGACSSQSVHLICATVGKAFTAKEGE